MDFSRVYKGYSTPMLLPQEAQNVARATDRRWRGEGLRRRVSTVHGFHTFIYRCEVSPSLQVTGLPVLYEESEQGDSLEIGSATPIKGNFL